ncbi:MAG: DUF2807 domain-containing protein [Oscillospiraceae bacterium]|nr:DUF2807 domain-containing protein [Bacteroidales bacterium]MBR4132863.1 DUF2807 domain-containing protein [Oscillospiraceae bacterium]
MKRIISIVAAAALLCSVSSCVLNWKVVRGNGVAVTSEVEVPAFSSISILGSSDVVFTQGPKAVSLTTDENLLEYYSIEVEEDKLIVSTQKGVSVSPKTKTVITVSNPDLSGVGILGSGDCKVQDGLKSEGEFSFTVTGSGDLYADSIVCTEFTSKVSGSGDVKVEGLTCESASLSVLGSGDIAIGCKDAGDFKVRISGSGDVKLWGNARTLEQKVSGSGSVDAKRLALSGAE